MSSAGFRFRCTRTVSGKPLATRFLAMPWPISPRPMNPTRGLSMLMMILPEVPKVRRRRSSNKGDFTATSGGHRLVETSIDRGGLGLRQVRPPAFVPRQHDATARDDDDPGKRPAVGKRGEQQPSGKRRPYQLHVGERRDRRRRCALKRLDEKKVPQRSSYPEAHERDEIGGGIRGVETNERYRRRKQHAADEAWIHHQYHQILAGELARQNLVRRIECRRSQRKERRRREHLASRPHDQEHADEARGNERPARTRQPPAQEPRRHQRDQHRRRVIQCRRFGERKKGERRKKAKRRRDQYDSAREMQREARRAHEIQAHPRAHQRKQYQRLRAPARPDQQRHRIALAEMLDGDVDRRETATCHDDQKDRRKRDMWMLFHVGGAGRGMDRIQAGANSRRARTEASRDFTRKAHNASHRPASCDAGPCNGGFMIGKILCSGLATVAAILLLAGGENAQAQPAAQHSKIVIQVSDGDQAKWNLALNNARNIQADLGAANVDIEIVAYGPGIGMLKLDSPVANRVDEANVAGVKVLACENTMKGQKLVRSDMLGSVGYVNAGVVEIMQRQQQGWAYIRP